MLCWLFWPTILCASEDTSHQRTLFTGDILTWQSRESTGGIYNISYVCIVSRWDGSWALVLCMLPHWPAVLESSLMLLVTPLFSCFDKTKCAAERAQTNDSSLTDYGSCNRSYLHGGHLLLTSHWGCQAQTLYRCVPVCLSYKCRSDWLICYHFTDQQLRRWRTMEFWRGNRSFSR